MKLYLGNLPYESTEDELREILTDYEPILDFRMPVDRETGRPRGFAFVTLENREIGERAIEELQGKEFNGRAIRAREAEDRPRNSGGGGGGGGGHRDRRQDDGGRNQRDQGKRYRSI